MLQFFRRYQKYFFLFTTIVIVSSFAFFGSYQAFAPSFFQQKGHDEIAFRTVDGKAIKRSYLEHMKCFLRKEEWMRSARLFEVNYLNDGVISKDFIEGGLCQQLLNRFLDHYHEQLQDRFEKERSYIPYQHFHSPSLSAQSIWSLFAREIPEKLATFKASETAMELFQARLDLFLAEKKFPPHLLTQVIRYQEDSNPSLPKDSRLMKGSGAVSLFGYQDIGDWFGERFVDSIAKVVINTAAIARQRGYRVSHDEILTELLFKSQKTYENLSKHPNIPLQNGEELFRIYLRNRGLDETTTLHLWEEITLFRRMMQEVGAAALVDTLPLEQFYAYANERATIDFFSMSPEFCFQTEEEAQLFEAYLEAVAAPYGQEIPLKYASIETIEARAPQLVGKQYHLCVGSINKEALFAKVSMKQTLDWELANWEKLQATFPQLAQKKGTPFECLEQVKERKKIDNHACLQIVENHPEWIQEALKTVDMSDLDLFLATSCSSEPLPGISDPVAFQKILESETEVIGFTQDQNTYYHIIVESCSSQKEILTFKEALAQKALKASTRVPSVSFVPYLQKYCRSLPQGELAKQWVIKKEEKVLTRATENFLAFDEIVALSNGELSSVVVDKIRGPYCFCLKEVFVDTTIPVKKWIEAQELLAKEMRAQFMENILNQLCSKNLSL